VNWLSEFIQSVAPRRDRYSKADDGMKGSGRVSWQWSNPPDTIKGGYVRFADAIEVGKSETQAAAA